MQEYYRGTVPNKGDCYNAVIATHVTWDKMMLKYRYFADPNDRRYIGKFVKGFHDENGSYWEQYVRLGTLIKLDYNCEGSLCFELVCGDVKPAEINPEKIAKIDRSITVSPVVATCCFDGCNNSLRYGGNNAQPIFEASCCDDCNIRKVIPARLKLASDFHGY